jgi:hypothetical protein
LHKWVVAGAATKQLVVRIPEFLNVELYGVFWRVLFPEEMPPLFTNQLGGEVVFEDGQYRALNTVDLALQISWPLRLRGSGPFDPGGVGFLYSSLLITPQYSDGPGVLLGSYRREIEGQVRAHPLSASIPVVGEYSYQVFKADAGQPLRRVPLNIAGFRTCCGRAWTSRDAVFVENMGRGGNSGGFEYFAARSELEEWYRIVRHPKIVFCARGRGRIPGRGQLVIVVNGSEVFRSNSVSGGAGFDTLSAQVALPDDPSLVRSVRLSFESIGYDPDLVEFADWALFIR